MTTILIHPVLANEQETAAYYAGRFNLPVLVVEPFGAGVRLVSHDCLNHRNEVMVTNLGEFPSVEAAKASVAPAMTKSEASVALYHADAEAAQADRAYVHASRRTADARIRAAAAQIVAAEAARNARFEMEAFALTQRCEDLAMQAAEQAQAKAEKAQQAHDDAEEQETSASWVPACGGTEQPFTVKGKTVQYMWNTRTGEHAYYLRGADVFLTDEEFREMLKR